MIIFAIENQKKVYAYNERQEKIFEEPGTLYNYTENIVAINRKDNFYIYNEKGDLIATYPKDFIDMSNVIGVFI